MSNPRALVVFDLDGTLLRSLTVCEVLAHSLGRLQQMQEMGRLRDRPQIAAARGDGNLVSSTLHGYTVRSRCGPYGDPAIGSGWR